MKMMVVIMMMDNGDNDSDIGDGDNDDYYGDNDDGEYDDGDNDDSDDNSRNNDDGDDNHHDETLLKKNYKHAVKVYFIITIIVYLMN